MAAKRDHQSDDERSADKAQRFESLRVKLAKRGFALTKTEGGYLITRWNRSAHLTCTGAIADFLARVEGTKS